MGLERSWRTSGESFWRISAQYECEPVQQALSDRAMRRELGRETGQGNDHQAGNGDQGGIGESGKTDGCRERERCGAENGSGTLGKLISGVRLIKYHPAVAYRSCKRCLEILYDEDTGLEVIGRDGEPEKRFFACLAPCQTDKGCPKGTPENQKSLTESNQDCYQHYLECKAVGQFPNDPIVRRNAALIRQVEDGAEQFERNQFYTTITGLLVNRE